MAFTKIISLASVLAVSLLVSVTNAAGPYFAITGPSGGVQPRLEIRQLFRENPDQWNLYLLALQQFQSNQQTYITSWFQIAGIHGAPNVAWDGVEISSDGIGYCCHGINLFPCWHRPYIALFEQKLQQAAFTMASRFPAGATRTHYTNLAQTLRAPYWDWAAAPPNGNPTFPLVVSQKYVTVNSPTGSQTIINPLFRYNFHPVESNQVSPYGAPWNVWGATLRYPTDASASNAVSQNNLAQSTLDNNRVSQRQSLYNFFTLCPNYDQISNDQPSSSSSSCHISLESLHNNIHVWVGGSNNGHMTIVPVSAFDPTFMLHHTMIDRLFAMWQTLYPNSYISSEPSQISTATIKKGDYQGPTSPLTPFHKDTEGTFWTCQNSRDWNVLSYTYPEFTNGGGSASSIRTYVNNLYGPNAGSTAGSIPAKRSIVSDVAAPLLNLTHVTHANNGSTYQYIANIQTSRSGLNGSYTVYMFFGEPVTEDPTTWGTASNMVGSYGVFAAPGMVGSDMITTSTVPLTDALTNVVTSNSSSILTTLEQVFVVPYLESQLQWRVATTDGTIVDPSTIPQFVVSVVSSTMKVSKDPAAFPTWSKFNTLTQITRGKNGGANLLSDAVKNLGKASL